MKFLKYMILILVLGGLLAVAYLFVFPDVGLLKKENPKKTAFMQFREKEWREKGKRFRIQQKWVPLTRISPYVMKAVIIAEDDKFWGHKGFDMDAIQKALEKDLEAGKFKAGGSTISQQLVKNLYLTPEKSPVRKLKEAIITWRIERALSKRRILEIYLNVVEWGEGIFGVEAAALHYFNKSALSLDPLQAAMLATILPNPRRYRIDNPGPYVQKRSKVIYDIMVRRGIVIPEFENVIKPVPGEISIPPIQLLPSDDRTFHQQPGTVLQD